MISIGEIIYVGYIQFKAHRLMQEICKLQLPTHCIMDACLKYGCVVQLKVNVISEHDGVFIIYDSKDHLKGKKRWQLNSNFMEKGKYQNK